MLIFVSGDDIFELPIKILTMQITKVDLTVLAKCNLYFCQLI